MSKIITDNDNSLQRKRLEDINELIIEMASGNFEARKDITENRDEYDALITGIHMLGEELKHTTVSRDYLNSIFTGIVDMMIVLSTDNTIQQINQPVADLLQYKEQDMIGQPINKFIKGNKRSLKKIESSLKENYYCHGFEREFRIKKGGYIPTSCSASYLYDNTGKVTGILYIAKDISNLKKIETKLINKNKELDTFVYKVSHDIKGPLASIMGITSIVGTEVEDPVALNYFELIKKCSEKLDTILKNLLQLAVMDQTKKESTRINFKKFIREIADIYALSPIFKDGNIKISIKQEKKFFNNEKMLHSVIQNLIDNAVKYKKPGIPPLIDISVKETADGVIIKVRDNGIGIKTQYQEKIFNMFFRANHKSEGTGLGLYMVKTYVDRMGGEIKVKSTENEGSTFIINLPNLE